MLGVLSGVTYTYRVKNLFDRNLLSDNFDETFVPLHNRRTFLLTGAYDF